MHEISYIMRYKKVQVVSTNIPSLSESQSKEIQQSKAQTQSKLLNCRDKIAVLKAKQSELTNKIRQVAAEISSKSEILSVS